MPSPSWPQMVDLDPRTLKVIKENRVLRLVYVLVALDSGVPGKDAAFALGISPGEIRRAMEDLKEALDLAAVPAEFDQSSGKWIVTSQARRLIPEARLLLVQAERFASLARAVADDYSGQIRLGVFKTPVKLFIAEALGALRAKKSFTYRVDVNPDLGERSKITSLVLLNQLSTTLDYAVVPVRMQETVDHHYIELYRWDLIVVTHDEHPLRRLIEVTPREISESLEPAEGLLVSPEGFITRSEVQRAFELDNIPMPIKQSDDDTELRYQLGLHGHGVAIVPNDALSAQAVAAAGQPWPRLRHAHIELSGKYILAWARGSDRRSETPIDLAAHELFVKEICDHARAFAESRHLVTSLSH